MASPKDRWANSSFQSSPDPNHLPMPSMLGSLMAELNVAPATPAPAPAPALAPSIGAAAAPGAPLLAAPKPAQKAKTKAKASTNTNAAASPPSPKTKGAAPAPKAAAAGAGAGAGPALKQPKSPAPKLKQAATAAGGGGGGGSSAAAAVSEADVQALAAVRGAITAKLRDGAMNDDAALLREGIAEAEAAGMTFEAAQGQRKLAALSGRAPTRVQPPAAASSASAAQASPRSTPEVDTVEMAAQRNAITAKLRDGAMNSNAALLREAISEAEAAGMTFEADLGKRKLAALFARAPQAAPVAQTQSPAARARAPPAAVTAAPAAPTSTAPAAAPPQPPAPAFDAVAMAAQRDAITGKLREAAMSGDAALLREAISEAEAAGLTFEADLGKRRLAALA